MPKKQKQIKANHKISPFEEALDSFVDNIESVAFLIPILMRVIVKERVNSNKIIKRFLDKDTRRLKNKRYAINIEAFEKFKELIRKSNHLKLSSEIVPKSLFIILVSHLDNHFKEIVKIILKNKPQILNSTEKNISISELFDLQNFAEAKRYVMNREIDQILESRSRYFNWLENKLDLKLNFDPALMDMFLELTERRNLFVHSNGIVDKKYFDVCKKSKIKFNKHYKIGEKLSLDADYFFQSLSVLYIIGVQLSQIVWRNIEPAKIEDADHSLMDQVVDLISRNKNDRSLKLSDFANTLNVSSEEMKHIFLINKALALKFMKKQKEAEKLIDVCDWSACGDNFKLAVAIIKNEFKEASEIMIKIGATSEMKQAYKDWPLFKEFGKMKIFTKTYKKIFGVSYSLENISFKSINKSPHNHKKKSL